MAKERDPIVIKKITIAGPGAHGGAWKVAFADFMTAMMCFFLVMWLLNQTPEVKKQVASYFSGPSMIENQMTSYGAELTLEKLFLDLINEPLKAAQTFMQPADFSPNLMSMGSKKIVMAEIAQQLGQYAEDVKIESNNFSFDIDDKYLFLEGTADPAPTFVDIMERVKALTLGLQDSRVVIDSHLYVESVPDESVITAKRVAENRLELLKNRIKGALEHDTVDVSGSPKISHARKMPKTGRPGGRIKFTIEQKEILSDGRKPRPLQEIFEKRKSDMSVYDDFVRRIGEKPKQKSQKQ